MAEAEKIRDPADETEPGQPCMDVIDALEGFCKLERRSATLDGSVLLRAARGCQPFLEGNAAGFQVRLSEPALLRVKDGRPRLQLPRSARAKIGPDYSRRIRSLVEAGVLRERGHWHRELNRGAVHRGKHTLSLWTGLLVRPAPGLWILQSRAFNRRSHVAIREAVIADDTAFVPVVLELGLNLTRDSDTWLTSELACLLPLWPDVEFTVCPIEQAPAVGSAFNRFYSPEYFERRREREPTGDYRHLVSSETGPAPSRARCRLIVAGGANVHRIRTFNRFVTASGTTSTHPNRRRLEFAVVRNITEIAGVFDGEGVDGLSANAHRAAARLRSRWKSLYGADALSSLEWVTRYVLGSWPPRRENEFLVLPWVFVETPRGWSSLSDGSLHDDLEGLRAVLATDAYFYVPSNFRCLEPGPIVIPRGAELGRVIPVPRQLLQAPIRMTTGETTRRSLRP